MTQAQENRLRAYQQGYVGMREALAKGDDAKIPAFHKKDATKVEMAEFMAGRAAAFKEYRRAHARGKEYQRSYEHTL